MLDYKDILTKRYVLRLSLREIAEQTGAGKSGVHDFLKAFEKCDELDFPLPPGITNAGIAMKVYGKVPGEGGRDESYEYPDYQQVLKLMNERKNMTLQVCWDRYVKRCKAEEKKSYQYRQFCELFGKWCEENYETAHFTAVIAQTMEVDFAGKTFDLINRLTGEITPIVVFVAILPYSQYIYAEGMESTKEMQWIEVNNNALKAFGGVPAIVVCDNCKQAVIANRDWIQPELNAYYSVDKAYLHKKVVIRASASVVKIFSLEGELIIEWPRATYKGEWKTDSSRLPKNYEDFSEWNSTYFIRKASTVGSNTTEMIKRILKSRKLEVQTYRLCMGVLGFTKKYSRVALEECCKRALAAERATYTYIKNTIGAVAEELGTEGYNTDKNKRRNEGSYIMDSSYSDMEKLLNRSRTLAGQSGKEEQR